VSLLGESLRLLRFRGFHPVEAKRPYRSFEGSLPCAKGAVPVRLSIRDWDFLEYPSFTVLERPAFLPELTPHLNVFGYLCYFGKGAVTLDRYDPATALAQCIDQATAVLDKLALDPNYRVNDILDEFLIHWDYGQLPLPWSVFLGDTEIQAKNATYFILEKTEGNKVLVASDQEHAKQLATALGAKVKPTSTKCWLFETNLRPPVPQRMPQTVKEVFAWLRAWDKALSAGIQDVLADKAYLRQKFVPFAIKSPVGWVGFGFDLDQVKRLGLANSPRSYRQYLHNAGGTQKIFRMSLIEVGSQYVHSRNLTYPDLRGRRIALVGCGAIGSFLAIALARLGAGTGTHGRLSLIDSDVLGAENLGRHVLGYPSLQKSKVYALRDEIIRQFPHHAIEAHSCDVQKHASLFDADLVIDATGEESVSELLNHRRIETAPKVPVLHTWIRGNGEAVQALWTDSLGSGCYRCMLIPDKTEHRKQRYRVLKEDPVRRTDGCRAYTPYAVSAAMHAAALATDIICAWLQGDPTPRFRTRRLETADVFITKNQNPSKMEGCPACGRH
jgi:molybdopterin/thiamine biosynthesis adenylyltransferase